MVYCERVFIITLHAWTERTVGGATSAAIYNDADKRCNCPEAGSVGKMRIRRRGIDMKYL